MIAFAELALKSGLAFGKCSAIIACSSLTRFWLLCMAMLDQSRGRGPAESRL